MGKKKSALGLLRGRLCMMISSVGLGFVSIDDSDHLAVFVKQNGHSLAGCGAHDSLRANPNNAYAAISGSDRVAVIDTQSWKVIDQWATGREPDALGIVAGR